ncbi:MAG: hypothetical protein JRN15_19220, partial [Nitrososphaerota archaeon]|nr:hypothetical protein [Nitrososphaerota archaeon]
MLSPSETAKQSSFDVEKTVRQFFESRASPDTRKNYMTHIRAVIGEPVPFVELAARDPREAKYQLVEWITSHKSKVLPSTIRTYLVAVKSLLDYSEVTLPWKSIIATTARPPTADIRAPPYEAVKKAYELADLRTRVIIGINLAGVRVGSYNWLRMRDLTEIQVEGLTIGRIVVYRGEPEQYTSFLTPETLTSIRAYLEYRQRHGEVLTETSPLVRIAFDARVTKKKSNASPKPIASGSAQKVLGKLWNRAGYPPGKRDWALAHGFRKYAET